VDSWAQTWNEHIKSPRNSDPNREIFILAQSI
jgi:hypothetical protein